MIFWIKEIENLKKVANTAPPCGIPYGHDVYDVHTPEHEWLKSIKT